jgi:probable HAF family extracellular repeat protein
MDTDDGAAINPESRKLRRLLTTIALAGLLIAAIAIDGCGSDGVHAPSALPIPASQGNAPGPESITSLSPGTAAGGSADLRIAVNGLNFDAEGYFHRSRVFASLDGAITLISPTGGFPDDTSTQLHGVIPAALMAKPGVVGIYVADWDPQGDVGYPTAPTDRELPFTVTAAVGSPVLGVTAAGFGGAARPNYLTINVPGSTDTRAFGINNSGQVVGRYDGTDGVTRGFLRLANGSFYTFSAPGAVNGTWGQDVSDDGVIVGRYFDADFNSHGFVLDHGRFREVEFPGAMETTLRGIGSDGQLTGNYIDAAGFETGFVHDGKGFRSVLYPNSDSTDVWDVTADGVMVGDWSDVAGNIYGYSVHYGQFANLNVPGAATVTSIRGINSTDTMVGVFDDSSGALHGFVRTKSGGYIQLDVPGAQDTIANRINDRSAIVGFYDLADGSHQGFIVTGWERGDQISNE